MDREYILDELGKSVYQVFSETVGAVINDIEEFMSFAVDMIKSANPSLVSKILATARTDVVKRLCHKGTDDNRGYAIAADPGNMFAKKIKLGDNFFSFDGFLNKYRNFVYSMHDFRIKLTLGGERDFFQRVFVVLKMQKVFLKGC
jgi:hypothetical protein